MARIDADSRFSAAGFALRSWRPVFAGFAIAVSIVIAIMVFRTSTSIQAPASQPASVASGTASPRAPVEVRDSANAGAGFPRVAQGFSPAIAALKGCATQDCEPRPARDDAPEMDPLQLPTIDLDSIAVTALAAGDSIGIDPLPPVPSIAVTPLDVENEGDRR
jgi:hypothetical protein